MSGVYYWFLKLYTRIIWHSSKGFRSKGFRSKRAVAGLGPSGLKHSPRMQINTRQTNFAKGTSSRWGFEVLPLVDFVYLVFTHMPGESYCGWFRSLWQCSCHVFRVPMKSFWLHWASFCSRSSAGLTRIHYPFSDLWFKPFSHLMLKKKFKGFWLHKQKTETCNLIKTPPGTTVVHTHNHPIFLIHTPDTKSWSHPSPKQCHCL